MAAAKSVIRRWDSNGNIDDRYDGDPSAPAIAKRLTNFFIRALPP
jgi:hypothetical protein